MSESDNKNDSKVRRRIEAYQKELEADPGSLVFVPLAEALNRLGDHARAAATAQAGLRYHESSVAGLLALAVAEAGRDRTREALQQIKAALIIDQDNPRALALMGRLLLDKGLARRAVQFLRQAVKLDPRSREYSALLERARSMVKNADAPVALPLVQGRDVPDSASPWNDEGPTGSVSSSSEVIDEDSSDTEHTVFDPESLRRLHKQDRKKKRKKRAQRREAGPEASDQEVTHFAGPVSRGSGQGRAGSPAGASAGPDGEGSDAYTTFDRRVVTGEGGSGRRRGRVSEPKVGGSAASVGDEGFPADFSPQPSLANSGEATVAAPLDAFLDSSSGGLQARAPADLVPPDGRTAQLDDDALAELRAIRPPPEAPSVRLERSRGSSASHAAERSGSARSVRARRSGSPAKAGSSPAHLVDPPSTGARADDAVRASDEAKASSSSSPAAPSGSGSAEAAAKPLESSSSRTAEPDAGALVDDERQDAKKVRARSKAAGSGDEAAAPSNRGASGGTPSAIRPAKKASGGESALDSSASRPAGEPSKDKPAKAPAKDVAGGGGPPVEEGASGRPATMFVDDAVWAIYGGERPEPAGDKAAAPKASAGDAKPKKKPAREPAPAKAAPAAARRRSVLVVRTSGWAGTATRVAALMLGAVVTGWMGYALATSGSGATADEAVEDIKGIAADMERGGLASLRAAEENILSLLETSPSSREILKAAEADVLSRIWRDFGESAEIRERALTALSEVETPTLETIGARVALSTAARQREDLDGHVEAVLAEFPESPKAWVVRARIAARDGRAHDSLRALYTARAIHPKRRETLLELARWHARAGAHRAADAFYEELLEQESFRDDVEILIERYAVAVISKAKGAKNDAESRLAGLIREELPHVAKDEVGRVSLMFAVATLGRGDVAGGLDYASNAESAYETSAAFKKTLGDLFVAMGEFARGREQYDKALTLAPSNAEVVVAIARSDFGVQAKLRRGNRDRKPAMATDAAGVLVLPFGRARVVPGRFELLEVTLDASFFPERAYAEVAKGAATEKLETRLKACNYVALARRARAAGKPLAVIKLLEKARAIEDRVDVDVELGDAYLARGDHEAARDAFEAALKLDDEHPAARLGLGRALAASGRTIAAIDALEPLARDDLIAPEALRLLATLKSERGDDAGAIALLERVSDVSPKESSLLIEMGRLHHARKAFDEALVDYRRAIEADRTLAMSPKRGRKAKDRRSPVDLYYVGRVMLRRSARRGRQLLAASLAADVAPAEAHFFYGKELIKKRKTRRTGRRHLELYVEAAPEGAYALQAERLLTRR